MNRRRGCSALLCAMLIGVFFQGALLSQTALPPPSQESEKKPTRAVVQIPFDFFTFSEKMPPGRYSITRLASPLHLLFRNLDDPKFAFEVFTVPGATGIPARDNNAKLIFVERDKTNFLAGIVNENGEQRITTLFGKTRRDTDIRKEVPITFE